ncbi:MAG: phosphoribosylamine--glycine ligase [Bacteroidota bacterium]
MNILILGSGGREHAFAWKVAQSPRCENLYIAPGNAGTALEGMNVPISPTDFEAIKDFVLSEEIQMVVVGPELPLVEGIYDFFQEDNALKEVAIIGPSKAAAELEGSKAFAKQFMQEFNIPTAAYREFTPTDEAAGLDYIAQQTPPIVLKADGLAAGKGVLILDDVAEAQAAFSEMLGGKFGEASAKVVIEDFLKGLEFSIFVLTDGKNYKILPAAKDYKRIGEGDTGLNTGGMGSVSPVPFLDELMLQKVEERIVKPTLQGIQQRGLVYKGFIFIGLIEVQGEPYVIEYNCRMGDPETQSVLARLKSDLVDLLEGVDKGTLNKLALEVDERAAASVILVSGGYPNNYEKGKLIAGLSDIEGSQVFHAGTRQAGFDILTNGGRVLAVTSYGKDFKAAIATSNANAEAIDFEGKYYRKDIGFDL